MMREEAPETREVRTEHHHHHRSVVERRVERTERRIVEAGPPPPVTPVRRAEPEAQTPERPSPPVVPAGSRAPHAAENRAAPVPAAPAPVHVTIGRITVSLQAPPGPGRSTPFRPAPPAMDLEAYNARSRKPR